MTEMNDYRHLTRKALLDFIQIHSVVNEKEADNDVKRSIAEYKFNLIEMACSAMQGTTDIEVHKNHLREVEQEISEAIKQKRTMIMDEDFRKIFLNASRVIELSDRLCSINVKKDMASPLVSLQELSETVYRANGQLEAESIQLFLESFGIRSRFIQESAGVALALTVGPLGEADVRVSPDDFGDALDILTAMKSGHFSISDDKEILEDGDWDQTEFEEDDSTEE